MNAGIVFALICGLTFLALPNIIAYIAVNKSHFSFNSNNKDVQKRETTRNVKIESKLNETSMVDEFNKIGNKMLKTPLSVLHELLAKKGHSANFTEISLGNDTRPLTFKFVVSYDDLSAEGEGKNKKYAKQKAAKALIDKLVGATVSDEFYSNYDSPSNVDGNNNSINTSTSSLNSEDSNKNQGNFVGLLKEFVDKKQKIDKNYPYPVYEIQEDQKSFIAKCKFLNKETVGNAASKKLAKQQAAEKMWRLMESSNFI
ncbi:CLUMA_CG018974, isoform A [Clunio marinus]|uniref:CLUMA_CG018974, isoform A n=1 Tax=Clunio marinus TaxID=568069 RepID=A0A1J1J189_9DIPT|nr:CLUMA_CG018974, isoform A [Clunio marinus]